MNTFHKDIKAFDDYLTLKNFSKATRRAYGSALRLFLQWRLKCEMTGALTQDQARQYILFRYEKGLSWQTINGDHSALMKYYRHVKNMEWDVDNIPRPRKEKTLPRSASKEDISKIIAHASNLKHQTFICLLYATGIRLGEAVNLKITDIDGHRQQLLIRKGKGAKDRYVDIPTCMLDMLRHYYQLYRPINYLFNGSDKSTSLAARSAQHLINGTRKRAGVYKKISAHTFRHAYATHHLENGTDLVYLQQQMGHKHLKTTAKYIHLMKTHAWRINHPIAQMTITYSQRIS